MVGANTGRVGFFATACELSRHIGGARERQTKDFLFSFFVMESKELYYEGTKTQIEKENVAYQ